jgi:hypothetical protein
MAEYTSPQSYDFDDLMDGFVRYLKTQDYWKDYNFEGAGLTQLMRLLSYNTQTQALENNFVISELFPDSAQIPNNVGSFASSVLGYIPVNKSASRLSNVTITVTPSPSGDITTNLVMDTSMRFFAAKDGASYIFSPDMAYQAALNADGLWVFSNVTLLQGTWVSSTFLVQSAGIESYELPNADLDLSTIQVQVFSSSTSTSYDVYNRFTSALDLGPTAQVFFLRKNRSGTYSIEFGDGKLANALPYGSVVLVSYLVTSGDAGNEIPTVTAASSISGQFNIAVTADDVSYGGGEPEDIATTKFNAPLAFENQGNAVTDADYVSITQELFPDADSVAAWGGEKNDPPKYGYVYVAVKPKDATSLSSDQQTALLALLQARNVGSITPILVDPQYVYVHIISNVRYNPNQTVLTTTSLKQKVSDSIAKYSTTTLERFNSVLNFSDIGDYIKTVDRSIKGSSNVVQYERQFVPELNAPYAYSISFGCPIIPGSVQMTGFRVADTDIGYVYSVIDDSAGNLSLTKTNGTATIVMATNYGTVNYTTGVVALSVFNPSSLLGTYVSIFVTPTDDVDEYVGPLNAIIEISNIVVNLEISNVQSV